MLRILIIDDEPLIRSVLRSGQTGVDAPHGRAGLALWREIPGDLVLADIFMREIDGSEVTPQLTGVWLQAKIIPITGGAKRGDFTPSMVPTAIQLGARHIPCQTGYQIDPPRRHLSSAEALAGDQR